MKKSLSLIVALFVVGFAFVSCTDGNNGVNSSSTTKLSKNSDGSGVKAIEEDTYILRPCTTCQVAGGGDLPPMEKGGSIETYDSTDWSGLFSIQMNATLGNVEDLTFYCGGIDGDNPPLPEFVVAKGFWVHVPKNKYQTGSSNTLSIAPLDGERWFYTWIISNQGSNTVTLRGDNITFPSSRLTSNATDLDGFINITLIAKDDAFRTVVFYLYIAVERDQWMVVQR